MKKIKDVLSKTASSVNADRMSVSEVHQKLENGYKDIEKGNVEDAASAFQAFMDNKASNKRKWTAEEVQQWYQEKGTFTYCNPNDLNVVVKKPRREGLTVNWANPKAYLLQGVILAVVLAIVVLLLK